MDEGSETRRGEEKERDFSVKMKQEVKGVNDLLQQFSELKQKFPDVMLLFRQNEKITLFLEDAVKAAPLLNLPLNRSGEKHGVIPWLSFPKEDLYITLPQLIRSGQRVTIMDPMFDLNLNLNNMPRKKKVVSEAVSVDTQKNEIVWNVEPKVADAEKKTADVKKKTEQPAEEAVEAKRKEPQMVTANGQQVTHGHAFQSNLNQADWYFTAKLDGVQLKPQKMNPEDLSAYQQRSISVPELMEKYYPTKLMPKVPEETFRKPIELEGPNGIIKVDKFNVYKEKDEQRPDFGKYKFYAEVGDMRMSAVASQKDLNAYFDRVTTPTQLVEKNFGEKLHLKSAYEKYQLPEGVDPKGVRIAKDHTDNKWKVSFDLGDKGKTSKQELSFDDGFALFKTKTASREQIAAKYLNSEITGILNNPQMKMEKSVSMKM